MKLENGWTKKFLDWDKLMEKQKEPRKLIVIEELDHATHWRALDDKDHNDDNVTTGKLYHLYYDIYDDEIVLFDDKGTNSTVFMWHKGECIVMEGSRQWYEFVLKQ